MAGIMKVEGGYALCDKDGNIEGEVFEQKADAAKSLEEPKPKKKAKKKKAAKKKPKKKKK